ncbi:MAG: cytochrome c oxidase subunit I [Actinomycetota bacterium]
MTLSSSDEHVPGLERPAHASPTVAEVETDEQLERVWSDPPGLWGQLRAVQNDNIGLRLMLTGFFFVILGGSVDSVVMRTQLAFPEMGLVGPQLYNELFTNHGSVTMFLVILPIFEGFAILLLPLLLGSREMPFPRLGAFAYWTFLLGGLLYYSATLFQLVPDAGWFAYTPLSGPEFSPDLALDFWVLGLGVAEVGAIAAAVEIIVGVLKLRAPGMTLTRLPLFAWAMLVTAFMILFAFTPLIIGSLLLELDRGFGTQFFNPDAGGSSLLWQHLFWIFGHPEVYIQFLPAAGIVAMVLPVMVRHRTIGYTWIVASMVGIGVLSFGLWAHHMFTTGLPPLVLAFFAAASMVIAIPAGVQIFAWVSTIAAGRVRWTTPMLFVMGFLVIFVIGGITGVMVAAVPFDLQVHDSYFVVGHLHYVLIGGVAFPIFAGVHYWWPKITGKMMDERLGRIEFWLLFVGVNVAFFPMHIVGLQGMPRRIYTYPEEMGWQALNIVSTVGVYIVVAGIAVFVWNVVRSYRHGPPAGHNPWGGDTLEWAVPSPPKQHGWTVPPVVTSRHPLWDQNDIHSGDTEVEELVQGMARWPLRWRAVLVTGTANARPEEIYRVADPSIWPLVAACGTVLIFFSELIKLRPGALLGALIIAGSVIMWNRPTEAPMTVEEERAFEDAHGIPVHAGGSLVISRWGMGLSVLFVSIGFASLLLAYFYLRLDNAAWPPSGIAMPDLGALATGTALVVAAAAAVWVALRRVREAGTTAFKGWLVAGSVIGIAAAVHLFLHINGLEFDSKTHAYGSIYHTLAGFLLLMVVIGAVMTTMMAVWAVQGHFTNHRHVPVTNTATWWAAISVIWVIGAATLGLGPVVT